MKHLSAFLPVLLQVTTISASSWAANICNETVPSNRMVDGIPAYQQCTESTNAAIYSNNGIDTATSSAGSDWTRTQSSGGYQCTEFAHRYLLYKWGVKGVPNGNAGVWCDGTIPSGLEKTATPAHGDLIVFAPGSCGADQTTGHVAVIDVVNTNATVTFVEQNRASRRSCANNTAACFLHATANNGTGIDGGTLDGPLPDSAAVTAPDSAVRPDRPADSAGAPDSARPLSTGGTTGSGGAPGTGGTSSVPTSSGGAMGAGGAPGTGGRPSTGGTTTAASAGGSGGTTSTSTTAPSATSDSGCSCRLGEGHSAGPDSAVALLMLVAGFALLRRRRR